MADAPPSYFDALAPTASGKPSANVQPSAPTTAHFGHNITLSNNIFSRRSAGSSGGVLRSAGPPDQTYYASFNLTGNILDASDTATIFTSINPNEYGTSVFDLNLYWRNHRWIVFPGNQSFWAWREHGVPGGSRPQDRHSRIADPHFVDADGGDFRLEPFSPAFKLGFAQIDFEAVGPRREKSLA